MGGCCGELSLLQYQPLWYRLVTTVDCTLLELPLPALLEYLRAHSELKDKMLSRSFDMDIQWQIQAVAHQAHMVAARQLLSSDFTPRMADLLAKVVARMSLEGECPKAPLVDELSLGGFQQSAGAPHGFDQQEALRDILMRPTLPPYMSDGATQQLFDDQMRDYVTLRVHNLVNHMGGGQIRSSKPSTKPQEEGGRESQTQLQHQGDYKTLCRASTSPVAVDIPFVDTHADSSFHAKGWQDLGGSSIGGTKWDFPHSVLTTPGSFSTAPGESGFATVSTTAARVSSQPTDYPYLNPFWGKSGSAFVGHEAINSRVLGRFNGAGHPDGALSNDDIEIERVLKRGQGDLGAKVHLAGVSRPLRGAGLAGGVAANGGVEQVDGLVVRNKSYTPEGKMASTAKGAPNVTAGGREHWVVNSFYDPHLFVACDLTELVALAIEEYTNLQTSDPNKDLSQDQVEQAPDRETGPAPLAAKEPEGGCTPCPGAHYQATCQLQGPPTSASHKSDLKSEDPPLPEMYITIPVKGQGPPRVFKREQGKFLDRCPGAKVKPTQQAPPGRDSMARQRTPQVAKEKEGRRCASASWATKSKITRVLRKPPLDCQAPARDPGSPLLVPPSGFSSNEGYLEGLYDEESEVLYLN